MDPLNQVGVQPVKQFNFFHILFSHVMNLLCMPLPSLETYML